MSTAAGFRRPLLIQSWRCNPQRRLLNGDSVELIRFLFARSRRIFVLTVVFGCLSGITNAGMLAVVNASLFRQRESSGSLLITFIVLCAIAPLTRVVSELLLAKLGQNAIFTLRTELARQVLRVPLPDIEQAGVHRILSVLTDDIAILTGMVSTVPVLFINMGVIVSCLAYLGGLKWQLVMALLALMALGISTYQLAVRRAAPYFKRARASENDLQKHYHGLLHGAKELKLHQRRRGDFLARVLSGAAARFRKEVISGMRIYSVAASWGQLLVFVIIGVSVFGLRSTLAAGDGVLSGFIMALLYLMSPLQAVMNAAPGLARAKTAIRNIEDLGLRLDQAAVPEENDTAHPPSGVTPAHVELTGVTYTYVAEDSADAFTLGPIDLAIRPGELLFVTGGNGSGKTTLAKLLVGLYIADRGEVRCNGELITDQNREGYRQLFSAVFSDFFLFESLLGFAGGAQMDNNARKHLSRLRLEHKVRVQDGVFSTVDLSQGQRKRLALLICCLENRPILFFDEWAADQDPAFKDIFYFSILPELKAQGKAVIVISHDERYYAVADRLVHLDAGRVTGGLPASLPVAANI
jgi:putative pyoverdin transport system ATP-binding/permease protein